MGLNSNVTTCAACEATGVCLKEGAYNALVRTARRAHVVVIGSLNLDWIIYTEQEPSPDESLYVHRTEFLSGGHAGNCAAALGTLGVSTRIIGSVGADANGRALLDDLQEHGVDTSFVHQDPLKQTGQVVIPVFPGSHYMLMLRGANDSLRASALKPLIHERVDAVIVFDPTQEVLRACVEQFAVEPHDRPLLCWAPVGLYSDHKIATEIIPFCDVIFLNRIELAKISRHCPDIIERFDNIDIVVTLGSDGSVLHRKGKRYAVPAQNVKVVDAIGGGDAFAATYVLARLADCAPEARLELANASGAFAVGAAGARGHLASLLELAIPEAVAG
jgi:ribokinase